MIVYVCFMFEPKVCGLNINKLFISTVILLRFLVFYIGGCRPHFTAMVKILADTCLR